MKAAVIGIAKAGLNLAYRVRRKTQRRDEAVFLSRQTDHPSYDFAQVAHALEERGWQVTMHLKKVSARNLPAYTLHVWREIGLLGRCKAVVLDRYDPVVSLIDFECEPFTPACSHEAVNTDFPVKPVVVQLWHAFGAFKKFGFQSNDTPEGHTTEFMKRWRIHRNNTYVVCSGEACRPAYAEAFACPVERVVVFDRPERDEIAEIAATRTHERAERNATSDTPKRILMAPTLRIGAVSQHPFKDLYEHRAAFEEKVGANAQFTWSFHPLDSGLPAPGNISAALVEADFVVTDYSSIAYEAYLLGVPVVFYMPDLQEYRVSPGLNADPAALGPGICTHDENELATLLARVCADPAAYPTTDLEAFAASAFDAPSPAHAGTTAAERLADFIIAASKR